MIFVRCDKLTESQIKTAQYQAKYEMLNDLIKTIQMENENLKQQNMLYVCRPG